MRRFSCCLCLFGVVTGLILPPTRTAGDTTAVSQSKRVELSRLKPTILTVKGLTKIVVGDSDVCGAMILSDDRIALEGRSAGTTTVQLYHLEGDQEKCETVEVVVPKTAPQPAVEKAAAGSGSSSAEPPAKPEGNAGSRPAESTTKTSSPVTGTGIALTSAPKTAPQPTTEPTVTAEEEPAPADQAAAAEETKTTVTSESPATPAAPAPTPTTPAAPQEKPSPALWLQLTVNQSADGQTVLSYSLTLGNNGPGDATNVVIRDVLPQEVVYVEGSASGGGTYNEATRELRWTVPVVKAGEKLTDRFTFEARLAKDTPSTATIHNVATCECREKEAMVASNTASYTLQSAPLTAIFALPDVLLARKPIKMPLLDVRGAEYRRAVDRLEGLCIIHGYPDRTFRPDEHVNRAESTKMVVLAADLKEYRDRTRLTYVLWKEATVTVEVANDSGSLVRTLVAGEKKPAGDHALTWDGLDDDGVPVPAGTYHYQVTAVDADGHTTKLTTNLTVVTVKDVERKGAPTFKDVVPTDWYAGYIAEAENRQYVRGYPDGTFRPHRELNRAEATAIVVRALGMEAQAQKRAHDDVGFLDQQEIPEWARGYVAVASTEAPKSGGQLIIGYPGNTFQPRNPIRRAEAAAMIERFIDRDVRLETTVAGVLTPGASLTLNGRVIKGGPHGQFRETISLVPNAMNTIAVMKR